MNNRKLIAGIALLAIIVSIGWTYSNLRAPRANLTPYQALGWGTAQETARFTQNRGEIAVICPDFGNYTIMNPRYDALLKSFKRALAKNTTLHITELERAPVNPPTMAKVGVYLSAEQYDAFSKKFSKASAIVAFVGLPALSDASIGAAQAAGAKWLVVSDYGAGYKLLLGKQAMQLAIIPRLQDPPEFPKPRTLQEQFKREYEVITPSQAPELP